LATLSHGLKNSSITTSFHPHQVKTPHHRVKIKRSSISFTRNSSFATRLICRPGRRDGEYLPTPSTASTPASALLNSGMHDCSEFLTSGKRREKLLRKNKIHPPFIALKRGMSLKEADLSVL
jgi:hypothetical protein